MTEPEIYEGMPAADGEAIPRAATSFAEFIRLLEDGGLDADLAVDLRDLATGMADVAIQSSGKSKGSLTLTLDFTLDGRIYTIGAKHKITLPEARRPRSVLWTSTDGRFTASNPAQGQLFGGVREVRGTSGFRDA